MEPAPSRVESGPPRSMEVLVWMVLPPACRESVLGDLHERYSSPARYLGEAVCVVPWVVASRIVRTTQSGLLLLEAFALYPSFAAGARFAAGPEFLNLPNAYFRMAVPVLAALLALVFTDAYALPGRRLVHGSAAALAAIWLEYGWTVTNSNLSVPPLVLLYGRALGTLLVAVLRAIFLPGDHRATGAR